MNRVFFFIIFVLVSFVHAQQWDTNRVIRYQPDKGDFVIVNGKNKFNRALYGVNTAFRIEAGDVPEFGIYLPGMGGSVKFALSNGNTTIWLSDAKHIEARYVPGSMLYHITDPILGKGKLTISLVAMHDEEGLIIKTDSKDVPKNVTLITVYGGASNEVFRRAGERNVDAADSFELKAENCTDNEYEIVDNAFKLTFGQNTKVAPGSHSVDPIPLKGRSLIGTFSKGYKISIKNISAAASPSALLTNTDKAVLPIVCLSNVLVSNKTSYFAIHNPQKRQYITEKQLVKLFVEAENHRKDLTNRFVINTPDQYLNAIGGALSAAGDGIWQDPSYLHGAISWRVRIPGWRAAYVAGALGWMDRAETHFTAYSRSQLTEPVGGPVERDPQMNLARVAKRVGNSMYSSGYVCPKPNSQELPELYYYDMNLVFFDALIRNINQTGDLEFAAKMWPAIERHLAWEKHNFDSDGDGLYDAFACIWASDALQYNGGGVTYSSAYNYYGNKMAAQLGAKLGKNTKQYELEAQKIRKAIDQKLWLSNKGHYAEYVDAVGKKHVHENAGLWSIYHSIDSELGTDFQHYQALRYVDTEIPRLEFNIQGLEKEKFHALSTTNWMPYYWSINNVTPAEQYHTALAYWKGGRSAEAFALFKSIVMDNLYCGSSPGNFAMMSVYNAASLNESYRDFADVVGIAARTIVEGLIGVNYNAINNQLIVKPGFPEKWEFASFKLPYLHFDYKLSNQKGNSISTYSIEQKTKNAVRVKLHLPAKTDKVLAVEVNGRPAKYSMLTENVGQPMIEIELPSTASNKVTIAWAGNAIDATPAGLQAAFNETKSIDFKAVVTEIYDPQKVLVKSVMKGSKISITVDGTQGHRTFFAKLKQGEMSWWHPVHLNLQPAIEIVAGNTEDAQHLNFFLKNNSEKTITGQLIVGKNSGNAYTKTMSIMANSTSELIAVPKAYVAAGTSEVEFVAGNGLTYNKLLANWALPLRTNAQFEQVQINKAFNDKVSNIFEKGKYTSNRSTSNTLQIPSQGMGDWCVPQRFVQIDDSGFRAVAKDDVFKTPLGLDFGTPQAPDKPNIAFVSLWDNYPDSLSVPLAGKAKHAYLLMAGSTNHMQSRMTNGLVTVTYTDGSQSILKLTNPETWAPIERDYYSNDFSFKMNSPRPYRVVLKTGLVARDLEKVLVGRSLDARLIPGGGAIILDLPLDSSKELQSLRVSASANDVVIGLMGLTLERN